MNEQEKSQMLDELLENLFNAAGHHPEAEFIKDFVSEQRENKVLSDSEIYQQCVNHLVRQSRLTHLLHITELKRKISSGIEELSRYNEWPSLSAIAFHAMEEHVKCLKKESSEGCVVSRNMLSGSQLRLRALESNNSEIQKLFKNYKI